MFFDRWNNERLEQLFASYKSRNSDSSNTLFLEIDKVVSFYAARRSPQFFLDDAQQAMDKLIKYLPKLKFMGKRRLIVYIRLVVRSVCIDEGKRRSRMQAQIENLGEDQIQTIFNASGLGPSKNMRSVERNAALFRSVEMLKPQYREVLELRFFKGLKFHEIAGQLEICPDTASSRCRSALRQLKAFLHPIMSKLSK